MDAFDAFDAAAKELMLRQGIKPSALLKRLRNITEAASEGLPLLQVLYCASDGWYGYSEAFKKFIVEEPAMPDTLATICVLRNREEFISDYRDDEDLISDLPGDYRIRHVQRITELGQHLMEKWPGIAKLVKVYMRNRDLQQQMEDIRCINFHKEKLLEYQKVRDSIAAETGRSDGKTEWNTQNFDPREDFSAYAPSALEAMSTALEAEQNELTLATEGQRDALLTHMTEAQYEAMLQSLGTKLPEELEAAKALWEQKEYLSFSDAVTKYGEHHYAVWQDQWHFDELVMHFLLLHPEYTERLASERDNEKCALQLGLCAASTKYCILRIAEVPRLAEWQVEEDDGRETISLL